QAMIAELDKNKDIRGAYVLDMNGDGVSEMIAFYEEKWGEVANDYYWTEARYVPYIVKWESGALKKVEVKGSYEFADALFIVKNDKNGQYYVALGADQDNEILPELGTHFWAFTGPDYWEAVSMETILDWDKDMDFLHKPYYSSSRYPSRVISATEYNEFGKKFTMEDEPLGDWFSSFFRAEKIPFGGTATARADLAEIVKTTLPEGSFLDVPPDFWCEKQVAWAVKEGITNGTTATTFSPNATCTRAQILTFLYRAAGEPSVTSANPFTDVKTSEYFYGAAIWAYEKGMVGGGTFAGATTCTRAETVSHLWKYAGAPAASGASFTDIASDADYAQAVSWAVANGVTNGTTATTFSPENTCTRAQIVTFLYRAFAD
ncbi:MAG: S-layer homology domain-containing protein, partial [Oscillibacter sp.]|nr:S-layer homology domain-containing protein [Oscillibacter sp.]